MFNRNLLKGRMVEKQITMEKLAEKLHMHHATLYRRFNQPDNITISDVITIQAVLNLSRDDVAAIFFAQ